jgi:hypothetical protein
MPGSGPADAEVQVGAHRRPAAGRADGPEALSLAKPLAALDADRREVEVRRVEAAIRRPQGDGEPGRSGDPREPDFPRRRRDDRLAKPRRDIDAAVLSGRIRVRTVAVARDHLAADGPRPVLAGGDCR